MFIFLNKKGNDLVKKGKGGVLNSYAKEGFGPNQFCGLKPSIETLRLFFSR